MNANEFWNLFIETGAPEIYLLYSEAMKTEETHVSDDPWNRPQSNGLQ